MNRDETPTTRPAEPPARPPRRRHLPSLGAFATFEIAAKHLSFTQAASELNVSQAAISQHIRGLEKALDSRLFLRKHNALELTSEGRLLLEAVTQGLDQLSDAVGRIGREAQRPAITLSGTSAGMSSFMRPLIDRYRARHPEIQFTLLASDENDRLQDFAEVDLAVICGRERSEVGDHLVPLCPEIVDPVCAPAYRAKAGPFDAPADLARAEIMELHRLHWTSDAIGWHPLRWSDWFQAHAPEVTPPVPGFVTNSYGMLVEAAIDGQGVILGWRHQVAHALADGRLERLFALPLATGRSYYLRRKPQALDKPHVLAFLDWLTAEVARLPALHGD